MNQPENMNAFLLQIKGDASFSLFSQVTDAESLSQTWKLCSKVAGHLEQGKRLENLSWRLFHLHTMMTGDSPNNKTHTFERLSKETGRKLDRERHLRLSQLKAPGRCANQPIASVSATIHHPTLLCSLSSPIAETSGLVNCTTITSSTHINFSHSNAWDCDFKTGSINFESFLSSFSPLALFGTVDYLSQQTFCLPENPQTKGGADSTAVWDSVMNRSPFNEQANEPCGFLNKDKEDPDLVIDRAQHAIDISTINLGSTTNSGSSPNTPISEPFFFDSVEASTDSTGLQFVGDDPTLENQIAADNQPFPSQSDILLPEIANRDAVNSFFASVKFPQDNVGVAMGFRPEQGKVSIDKTPRADMISNTNAKTTRVGEKRKRRNPMATRLPTFVGVSELPRRSLNNNSISEEPICVNCRGTQTPLWRRGPSDELLCNACGVFYKVHKKHRPATLSKYNKYMGSSASTSNGETGQQGAKIQCTNCDATATPMWRKAPDGSLLCNACALYYKCHKRPRPTNASKRLLNRPLGSINTLFNSSYDNGPTAYSLGTGSPKSGIYLSDPSIRASDLNAPFTNRFDTVVDGNGVFGNELNSNFDFFKIFPTPCYATSNL
ncbi:hypothetical protein H4Q26_009036 [Puccinia striiformis f. sp. tritici PST-130]|nr:hypothetical protein Pst134EB_022196 [Puccinia striiformis f. sp. tritici]KAI9614650.1 hypothetical protein H4Q26_009036 [Puccinia striiformis f. sp. tritici PST-130]